MASTAASKWRRRWGLVLVNEFKEVGNKCNCTRKHLEELEASRTTNCRQARGNACEQVTIDFELV